MDLETIVAQEAVRPVKVTPDNLAGIRGQEAVVVDPAHLAGTQALNTKVVEEHLVLSQVLL